MEKAQDWKRTGNKHRLKSAALLMEWVYMYAMQSNTILDPVSERVYKAAAKQKWRNGDKRVV